MSAPAAAQWESEALYLSGDEFYRGLIAEIDAARTSVDMEVYTFEAGLLADRLCESFRRAHVRGVRVRLICDHWGSPEMDEGLYERLVEAGVKIRIFRGLPWSSLSFSRFRFASSLGRIAAQAYRRFRMLNRGFHRKVTIIDSRSAWVGSFNVTDLHLGEVNGEHAWVDVGMRVTGGEVQSLCEAFKKAFYRKRLSSRSRPPRSALIRLNDSRALRRFMNFSFRERMRAAMGRIWIQTPYFVPPRRLLRALCQAARRGVDVRLILPSKNDYRFIRWMGLGMLGALLRSGAKVMEYQGAFAHKKVTIIDDRMFIGSMNLNYRSFLHDLEAEIAVSHESSKARLEASFLEDQSRSLVLNRRSLLKLPFWVRWISRLLFFFRYWC